MAEVTAQMVKLLREKTGAGMLECKKALTESNGNPEEAEVILRKRGIASAAKKATRSTKQGTVGTYIHPGAQLGVLIEVNCESDFVARTDDFQELVRDLAMHVAAADPRVVRREEVSQDLLEKEKDIARDRARNEGKPEKILDRIVEGRIEKFYEEVVLLEQPFIKDNTVTIGELINQKIAKLGENITIARFTRMKVGETAPAEAPEAEAAAQ
jgi:elongation factor Ts